MTINIYSLYNTYLDVYEAPIFQQYDKKDIVEGYRRLILSDTAKAYEKRIHECRLVYLGTWDDQKGIIDVVPQIETIVELASLFPRGYIAKRELAEKQAEAALADVQELC